MAEEIDLVPKILNLSMYSGDGFSFNLVCKDMNNAPIDVRGTVKAQIRLDRLHPDDSPVAEFSVNMTDAYQGVIGLSLTSDQTQGLTDNGTGPQAKFIGVWDLEWTPSGLEPRTICQGVAECVADVTR